MPFAVHDIFWRDGQVSLSLFQCITGFLGSLLVRRGAPALLRFLALSVLIITFFIEGVGGNPPTPQNRSMVVYGVMFAAYRV